MFENDDVILPDGFEEAPPQAEEAQEAVSEESFEESPDSVEETKQTEELTEQQQEEQRQAFLKVKYNKEEMDLDEDTARELAQKGLNYDKVQERLQALESDPRLGFVEELAKEQGMTTEQYLQAVQEYKEQERINELVQKGISEDVAQELLENRKFREQYEAEQKTKQEEAKKDKEFGEFFDFFKQANGRDFDSKNDQIPQEVWDANKNGVPLKYAYLEHHTKQLQAQLQTIKQNEENAKKAPVQGVTAHGSMETAAEDDFMRGFNSI